MGFVEKNVPFQVIQITGADGKQNANEAYVLAHAKKGASKEVGLPMGSPAISKAMKAEPRIVNILPNGHYQFQGSATEAASLYALLDVAGGEEGGRVIVKPHDIQIDTSVSPDNTNVWGPITGDQLFMISKMVRE